MMEGQYNRRSPAVKRLMREAHELREPTEQYFAQPLEDNLFEWHFTLRGPADTDFEGGIYHGRIILPPDYPMKPPSIILLTPNGRFEVYKKICLSISGHHPESWQPSWSIRTALLAIIGFMPTHGNGAIGSLDYTPEERKVLSKKTHEWKCPECGSIKNILKPVTAASDATKKEAQELAAQINFQGEKEKGSESSAPSTPAPSTPAPSTPSAAAADASPSPSPASTTAQPTPPPFSPAVAAAMFQGGRFPFPMPPPGTPPHMFMPPNMFPPRPPSSGVAPPQGMMWPPPHFHAMMQQQAQMGFNPQSQQPVVPEPTVPEPTVPAPAPTVAAAASVPTNTSSTSSSSQSTTSTAGASSSSATSASGDPEAQTSTTQSSSTTSAAAQASAASSSQPPSSTSPPPPPPTTPDGVRQRRAVITVPRGEAAAAAVPPPAPSPAQSMGPVTLTLVFLISLALVLLILRRLHMMKILDLGFIF